MKVSLNKANKLRNALEGLKIDVPTTGIIRSDTPVKDIHEAFSEAVALTQKAMEQTMSKLTLLFKLRGLIASANAQHEIHTIIGDIARHERALAWLNQFNDSRAYRMSSSSGSSLSDTLAAIKHGEELKAADPKLAYAPKNFSVSLMTKEILEDIDKTVKTLRLELEELKEKRNELNHTTTIELPKDLVEFLREYALIK